MNKTKIFLVVAILLAFAAGMSLGLFLPRKPHRSWLTAELNLTSQQEEQLRKIWSESMNSSANQQGQKRLALAKERDAAIVALLSDEQKTKYQALLKDYSSQMNLLAQERKKAFEQAVARTREILTPEQLAKYDELMKKQRERGPDGPPGSRGPRRHRGGPEGPGPGPMPESEPAPPPPDEPTTAPANGPQDAPQ